MGNREEFFSSKEADLIMDLLIDVTGRSDIRDILEKIDPNYNNLLEAMKAYELEFLA